MYTKISNQTINLFKYFYYGSPSPTTTSVIDIKGSTEKELKLGYVKQAQWSDRIEWGQKTL